MPHRKWSFKERAQTRTLRGTFIHIKVPPGFIFFHPNEGLEVSDHHHILSGRSTHEYYRLREIQINRTTLILRNRDFPRILDLAKSGVRV